MANKDIEIEIKFPLNNPAAVILFLDKHAQSIAKNIIQKDTYYTPAHRNFISPKYPYEWLRLRESEKGSSFNYKHYYPENQEVNDFCDEFETKVSFIDTMIKILKSLDFTELCVVDKSRSTWIFKDVEIVIDEVRGLDTFIELEYKGDLENVQEVKTYLHSVLNELDASVGEEDFAGYPMLLLQKPKQ